MKSKTAEKLFFIGARILLALVVLNFALSAQQPEPPAPKPENTQTAAQVLIPKNSASEKTAEPSDAPTPPETAIVVEELIHLNDILDVDVLGSLEYDWRGTPDSEGFLSQLPLAKDSVFALCRTEGELAQDIAAAYSKILRNPEVVVRVVDRSARPTARILGAVRTPARMRIERPASLKEIIVLAGGITERASGEIKVFRPAFLSCAGTHAVQNQSETLTIKIADLAAGKIEANPFVRIGDIITVEEAQPIFVTGAVAAPQAVLVRNQKMTLTRAIASAGGALKNDSKITIYRRSENGEPKIIEADFEKIRKKQAEDVALEAFDIVEVGDSGSERKTRPPLVTGWETTQVNQANLPLRIVN